jgi:hypothetical protein
VPTASFRNAELGPKIRARRQEEFSRSLLGGGSVRSFQYGSFDDQADSLSQFLMWAADLPTRFHIAVF